MPRDDGVRCLGIGKAPSRPRDAQRAWLQERARRKAAALEVSVAGASLPRSRRWPSLHPEEEDEEDEEDEDEDEDELEEAAAAGALVPACASGRPAARADAFEHGAPLMRVSSRPRALGALELLGVAAVMVLAVAAMLMASD